jgi:YD repeat-containing protein
MDADGTIDYTAYDTATGAVVKTITDVNTQDTGDFTGLPAGWTTPAGGGLELITTMQVDALGRTVEETDPDGNVTCTVYNDAAHEVRTYPGWNSTTHTTTGPIEVQREYWPQAGAPTGEQTMYEETLTSSATPTYNATTNLPTGQETIDQTNIQSLSRSLLDDAGQVVEVDRYFSLTGVTYSAASPYLGTAGDDTASGNYFATLYGYDIEGRSDRVQDPAGNITDTVYDALGRVTSVLVGTDDTPGSSNMVDVQDNVYDNGGVGDGDLTQTTLHPGAGQPDRVTQYVYDWRDRQIAAQTGNNGSTTGPISYQVLDNLGEVVEQETFAGDGVTLAGLGATNGVPNPPSSDALCAQTTTEYDDQGRPYQTTVAVIDQGSGQVTSTQTTEDWYDGRGDLIETLSPAGLATKSQYDGAGRLVLQAQTDGGGGTSYAAAGSLDGDVVFSQTECVYDGDGHTIETIQKTRLAGDLSTDTGPLGDPATAPLAQVTYATSYFDAAGRDIADVDPGTNGGTAYTRPADVPAASDTALVTATTYNAAGLAATVTDPLGDSTQYAYDMLGDQTVVTDADGSTTSYTYDGGGNMLSLTDPDGNTTTWVYQNNQPVQETTPLGTSTATYDQLGDLVSQTDADGRVTTYSYNSLGEKTAENWLDAEGNSIYTFTGCNRRCALPHTAQLAYSEA